MVVTVCDKRTCPCFEEGAQPIEQSLLTKFEEILPATHNHVVCRCRGNEDQFDAVFHTNIFEESEAVMWLKSFEDSTKTTWRSFKTYPEVGSKVLFKKDYCCQHNTRPRSSTADTKRGSKNTGCCARIKITVNNTSFAHKEKKFRLSRSKDPHRLENPTQIVVKFEHNHPLNGASALKHRDVSEDAKAKIDHLLLDGYAPSAALEKFKFDLQLDDPDNYVTNSGDRAICPDLSWVYRRSYHLGTKKNGNKDCPNDIKDFVDSLNLQFLMDSTSFSPAAECRSEENFCYADESGAPPETDLADTSEQPSGATDTEEKQFLQMESTQDGNSVVAICTPLMHRVHSAVRHSGEMVFIDSTGNVDRSGYRVFLLLTHSCVGGLPLGVLITSKETTDTFKLGLDLLCNLVGKAGFFGRGKKGPRIFMIDDSRSERAALEGVFPGAQQFLCSFHLLQAFWRYLWDQKTGVPRPVRKHIFCLVKDVLCASDREEMERCCETIEQDGILQEYTHVQKHIKKNLLARRSLWALSHREGLLLRGNRRNSFCEAAMRVLKDQVLRRTKAFNTQQLVEFICFEMEAYYERRCIEAANDQLERVFKSCYLMDTDISEELVNQIGEPADLQFDVTSSRNPAVKYRVDMSVGFCTCPQGNTGGPCKHQAGVVKKFKLELWNFVPETNSEMKQILYFIGTGKMKNRSCFLNLRDAQQKCQQNSQPGQREGSFRQTQAAFISDAGDATDSQNECVRVDRIRNISEASNQGTGFSQDTTLLVEHLQQTFSTWIDKLQGDPLTYSKAFEAFEKNASKLKSASQLTHALHTFGKFSGFTRSRNDRLVFSRRTGIQPTALQRRKRILPGCKRPGVGRLKLSTNKRRNVPGQEMLSGASLPKKRRKATHSLLLV